MPYNVAFTARKMYQQRSKYERYVSLLVEACAASKDQFDGFSGVANEAFVNSLARVKVCSTAATMPLSSKRYSSRRQAALRMDSNSSLLVATFEHEKSLTVT